MAIKKITVAETSLDDWGAVPEPIECEPSQLSGTDIVNADGSEVGVWESTPGRWRRQITAMEMCYFLEGECSYTDEEGKTTEIRPGDLLYFPAGSLGVWDIRTRCRKVFITVEPTLMNGAR